VRDLGPKVDLTVGGDGLELHELQVLRGELQLRERNTILFTEEQAGLSGSSLKVKSKSTLLSIFQFVCTDREIISHNPEEYKIQIYIKICLKICIYILVYVTNVKRF